MKSLVLLLTLSCFSPYLVLGQNAVRSGKPQVFLDHVYLVLDAKTYKDIVSSEFMKEQFSNFREKTTILDSEALSAAYVNGKKTYIEIFEAGKDPKFKLSMVGIGFIVEEVGASDVVRQQLDVRFAGKAKRELSTVRKDNKDVPLFYAAYVDYGDNNLMLATWVMEYHKDYFASRLPDAKPTDGTSRELAMARTFDRTRYLQNITEVTLALSEAEIARLTGELGAFGYKPKKAGNNTVFQGPEVDLVVTLAVGKKHGITKLKLSLLRKKAG